jgi:hypothetical protein
MATTKEDIRQWLHEGKKQGATHVLVVCDQFDWEDYPVYVKPGEDVRKKVAEYQGQNMQKIMECYSMKIDLDKQLAEHRSFNYD